MTLRALVVDLPPRPLAVARALADEPGCSFLWTATGDGPSYVACWPVETASSLDPEPSLPFDGRLGPLADVPRWIGVLPYESRRSLERPRFSARPDLRDPPLLAEVGWQRFGAVVRIADDVAVVGDDESAVRELARRLKHAPEPPGITRVEALPTADDDAAHAARIARARELILDGELYQVNLARRFDFRVTGGAVELVARLAGPARAPYAAALDVNGVRVVSSSPELFLDVSPDGRVVTVPIKGTRPRGADAVEDRRLASELDQDPKEQAELVMIVDVERNVLGRVARTGSVRLSRPPAVETHGPVHHRAARVVAALRPGVGREELLGAMLPSGSVTGAPKVRAMEVIRSLEAARRGLYTGALGYVAHSGAMRLSMAIRVLTVRDESGHYFAGGGIVEASDPEREVLETRWKAQQALALLALRG